MAAVTVAAGVTVRSHAAIDEHGPGAHGRPQWLSPPSPLQSWELVGRLSASDMAIVALAAFSVLAAIIPVLPSIACDAPAACDAAWCNPHNVPLPSSVSCKRRTPKSAAKERRTMDIGN